MKKQSVSSCVSKWIFVACGFWLIVLGGYFMFARPPLLPEDLRYMGSSAGQVELLLPRLASWLRHVFTVMGGFIAGSGVLATFVGLCVIPQRLRGTSVALGLVGLLTFATMSWTNFALDSDYKWPLLAIAIVWLLGLVSYVAGKETLHVVAGASHSDIST